MRRTARAALPQALPGRPDGRKATPARLLDLRLLVAALRSCLYTGQRARSRGVRPTAWRGELPRQRLLNWLADGLQHQYPEDKAIHWDQPLPGLDGLKR